MGRRTKNNSKFLEICDVLAIDNPLEYVRLMQLGEIRIWIDALDNIEV